MIALTVYFAVGLSHPAIERQDMINPNQLREMIIEVLSTAPEPRLNSPVAVELLMLTFAVESHLGTYLKQVKGPALGIGQMEPFTEEDLWRSYLKYNKPLRTWVHEMTSEYVIGGKIHELKYNLAYQIAMTRLHYWRRPEPLPPTADPYALAEYWKDHYNTHLGKGTVTKAVIDYKRLVLQLED